MRALTGLSLCSILEKYMFSLPSSFLTFRLCVSPSWIKVAFFLLSSIFISAEYSSVEMEMVMPSSDLVISASFAQSIPNSSLRKFMSSSLSSSRTLSQQNFCGCLLFSSSILPISRSLPIR